MPQPPSITAWIHQLKDGNSEAAQRLWEQYFQRMVNLARRKLEGAPRAVADEEDVALSAFRSFCIGAREGRFSRLTDRNNLWPLLVAITAHKSVDRIRAGNRRKRGGAGRAAAGAIPSDGESPRLEPDRSDDQAGRSFQDSLAIPLSELVSREPTPEFAAELSDQFTRLLHLLDATGDADLRRIALLRMDGFSAAETAARISCATRSVERKMQVIMRVWSREFDGVDADGSVSR